MVRGGFLILRGRFLILRGRFLILRWRFLILCGRFLIVRGGFLILRRRFLIVRGGFLILRGRFLILHGRFIYLWGWWPTILTARGLPFVAVRDVARHETRSLSFLHIPAGTGRSPGVESVLGQRRRRWASIDSAFDGRLVFCWNAFFIIAAHILY